MVRVHLKLAVSTHSFQSPTLRYQILEWAAAYSERRAARVVAFGFGAAELRVLLETDDATAISWARALKSSTSRQAPTVVWNATHTAPAGDVVDAVAWCHRAPVEAGAHSAIASPWSSHRDLCGFRRAPFFHVDGLRAYVSRAEVEARLGSADHAPGSRRRPPERAPLPELMRIAASVVGVLPSDRRCFRLFVHVARLSGWDCARLASALTLTPRRVRQLAAEEEPNLSLALTAVHDPWLAIVP